MQIAAERLTEGDILPSVRHLADEVGINMHTVNKAYGLLREEGFLVIDRRKGAIIQVSPGQEEAIRQLRENLQMAIARCRCKAVSREAVHELVDEIYDSYEN